MGKRKELLTEFLSFFYWGSIPLPMWHPDGVRRVLGVGFSTDVAPRWGAEGYGVDFCLPMWHPDGVRRVMGLIFVYRCGTPMGCGGSWGLFLTDRAPRWGAVTFIFYLLTFIYSKLSPVSVSPSLAPCSSSSLPKRSVIPAEMYRLLTIFVLLSVR